MSRSIAVTVELPETMLRSLGQMARAAGVSPTSYLRSVLATALGEPGTPTAARTVGRIISLSQDWLDLQRRLRGAGYVLRRGADGALMLHDWPLNRPILPLDELGYSLAALKLGFRAEFPVDIAPSPPSRKTPRRAA